ncbi:DUF4405 domain-containing protein [Saccharicrinis sp. FJH62]|uniref:DUF4405 domain-containing protein n=1 Tax=Saccharicrinis sp. FJH62 TaxID=3344657 RepID=UPI0035D48A24
MKKYLNKLIINFGLLFWGFATVFSGLLIQVQYHIGNHGNDITNKYSLGLDYSTWSVIHKISIIMLSVLAAFHISRHWKWYKTVIAKRLVNKNKQVFTLSVIFVVVAITGFIPWIIDVLEGSEVNRKAFIEIHDKIAIILSVYFTLHIMKRLKWFLATIEKINKKTTHNPRS